MKINEVRKRIPCFVSCVEFYLEVSLCSISNQLGDDPSEVDEVIPSEVLV